MYRRRYEGNPKAKGRIFCSTVHKNRYHREASESSNRGKSRRATAKISFQRNDMSKVLTDISSATTDKRKRDLKINWWKKEVMPKIADLWNKQTVLKLADFDANKNTIGDSVELSFRTLSKVNKKDTLKNNY